MRMLSRSRGVEKGVGQLGILEWQPAGSRVVQVARLATELTVVRPHPHRATHTFNK